MLNSKQKAVVLSIGAALILTTGLFWLAAAWLEQPMSLGEPMDHIRVWAACSAVPGVFLIICIARLARHRLFSPDDIDGSGLTTGTPKAKSLQAQLQNTLEQSVLAVIAYAAWIVLFPNVSLAAVGAILFATGRALFLAGYDRGAPSRAFGFALTFIPSTALLLMALWRVPETLYRALS